MSSMFSRKKPSRHCFPGRLTSLLAPSHPALCPSRNLADLSSFVSSILSDHLPKSFRTSTSLFPLLPHGFTGPCQYQSAALSTLSPRDFLFSFLLLIFPPSWLKEDLGILFLLLLISVFPKTRSLAGKVSP